MPSSRQPEYLNCPNCSYTARAPSLAWIGTDCPRCRAKGKRIELLVKHSLRAAGRPRPPLPG